MTHECNVLVKDVSYEDMGIETEGELTPCTIQLFSIDYYYEDKDMKPMNVIVVFAGGNQILIDTPYKKFNKIYEDFIKLYYGK